MGDTDLHRLEVELKETIHDLNISINKLDSVLAHHIERHDGFTDKFWKVSIPIIVAVLLGAASWVTVYLQKQTEQMGKLTQQVAELENVKYPSGRRQY